MSLELLIAATALGLALVLRPWRAVAASGPPWPWLVCCAAMPWLWSADLISRVPLAQPLSGACLLVLLAGWPMAMLGAGVRRWLPHHLMVYILGRGFFASLLSLTLAGVLAMVWRGVPDGLSDADLLIGRWLAAWGDAFLTGMIVSIFVAFRPEWLATYSDRLYLPR